MVIKGKRRADITSLKKNVRKKILDILLHTEQVCLSEL
jgi:hypothetical protein